MELLLLYRLPDGNIFHFIKKTTIKNSFKRKKVIEEKKRKEINEVRKKITYEQHIKNKWIYS